MKFYKLDNWDNDFRHDGLLYFSQRIQEMLFYYSDHIYKAPVLNSYLLIREYINTAKLVRKKVIKDNHLKYIMEEFQDTFSNDIVLIVLWVLASLADIRYISVVVCFVAFLFNDIYGYISWQRMKKRQSS